jgi:hypothetical protein
MAGRRPACSPPSYRLDGHAVSLGRLLVPNQTTADLHTVTSGELGRGRPYRW